MLGFFWPFFYLFSSIHYTANNVKQEPRGTVSFLPKPRLKFFTVLKHQRVTLWFFLLNMLYQFLQRLFSFGIGRVFYHERNSIKIFNLAWNWLTAYLQNYLCGIFSGSKWAPSLTTTDILCKLQLIKFVIFKGFKGDYVIFERKYLLFSSIIRITSFHPSLFIVMNKQYFLL